ncbi:MAG: hypothetical protein LBC45_01175 [Chlamydiales bacterium]|jgi:hypothetical protein|nr:hypothetical protein [Chlamydiales bacterium]
MGIHSIGTFTQRALISSFKVTHSIAWSSLSTLSLPFFVISRRPFDFFTKKSIEVWRKNTTEIAEKVDTIHLNKKDSLKTTLEEWVEKAPEGENRILAQKEIVDFLELSIYQSFFNSFLNQRSDLDLASLGLTSLPDIFHDPRFHKLKTLHLWRKISLENCPHPWATCTHCKGCTFKTTSLENYPNLSVTCAHCRC